MVIIYTLFLKCKKTHGKDKWHGLPTQSKSWRIDPANVRCWSYVVFDLNISLIGCTVFEKYWDLEVPVWWSCPFGSCLAVAVNGRWKFEKSRNWFWGLWQRLNSRGLFRRALVIVKLARRRMFNFVLNISNKFLSDIRKKSLYMTNQFKCGVAHTECIDK